MPKLTQSSPNASFSFDGETGEFVDDTPQLHSFYFPGRVAVTVDCGPEFGEGAKQSFKDECDINTILLGYARTGQLEHLNPAVPTFADLPDQIDFQEALAIVEQSDQAFGFLPSQLRDHYQNNPAKFLEALHDPSEKDRLTEWGIFRPAVGSARPDAAAPAPSVPPTEGAPSKNP